MCYIIYSIWIIYIGILAQDSGEGSWAFLCSSILFKLASLQLLYLSDNNKINTER